jgi:hypothetical protein
MQPVLIFVSRNGISIEALAAFHTPYPLFNHLLQKLSRPVPLFLAVTEVLVFNIPDNVKPNNAHEPERTKERAVFHDSRTVNILEIGVPIAYKVQDFPFDCPPHPVEGKCHDLFVSDNGNHVQHSHKLLSKD